MASQNFVDYLVQTYGDLIFDICQSVLRNSVQAQFAFRSVLKRLRAEHRTQKYSKYERSWVLRTTCDQLLGLENYLRYSLTPQEQIQIDAAPQVQTRLSQFDSYFRRLMPSDQILLLLKDKHSIPYSEISAAMAAPEASLKIRRQQALRSLSEWIWNSR